MPVSVLEAGPSIVFSVNVRKLAGGARSPDGREQNFADSQDGERNWRWVPET